MYALFETIDGWLPVAPSLRVAIWGALTGAFSMFIYRLVSPQAKLSNVRDESRKTSQKLGNYDGDFRGLLRLLGHNIRLAMKRVGLSLTSSLLAGACAIPLLMCVDHQYSNARSLQTNPSRVKPQQQSYNDSLQQRGSDEWRVFSEAGGSSTGSTSPKPLQESGGTRPVAASLPSGEYLQFGPPWMRSWWFLFIVSASFSALGVRALIGIA